MDIFFIKFGVNIDAPFQKKDANVIIIAPTLIDNEL